MVSEPDAHVETGLHIGRIAWLEPFDDPHDGTVVGLLMPFVLHDLVGEEYDGDPVVVAESTPNGFGRGAGDLDPVALSH